MSTSLFCYKRPELARALCDGLRGLGIANLRSGLFLAGPRRVGKSTFLKNDLSPEAENRLWAVVYVDLWSDRNADPAWLIGAAVRQKIAEYQGALAKLVKAAGSGKINVMGALELDFKPPGAPDKLTLSEALKILGQVSGRPVLLIVDEAQHALLSPSGVNAMFAIKSARDQLNNNDQHPALMLVLTGSSRDKLAQLVLKKDQPFFGSQITRFPLLDRGFSDAFADWANQSLACDNQFSKDSMWQAFKRVGHRPETLRELAGDVAIRGGASYFADGLVEDAELWHRRVWGEFEREFQALTPLQQAVLEVMVREAHAWVPYGEASLAEYRRLSLKAKVTPTAVQTAIQVLRERGLIWQSGRGAYALEDESFSEWFRLRGGAKSG